MTISPELAQAYEACRRITKQRARNFAYGISLLPLDKRAALSAVYAFARRVDDAGDGALPEQGRAAALDGLRAQLSDLGGDPCDPVRVALADAAMRFSLPLEAFDELIDGVEMDLTPRTYATLDELVGYARRVAGTIGRLSLAIFGCEDPAAPGLADSLGVALQLTNILRDVREDHELGRIYLPQDDLERFGVDLRSDGPEPAALPSGSWAALVHAEVARTRYWYSEGLRLLPLLDRRSAACAGAMAAIYHRLLGRIDADPAAVAHQRVSLPAWEKALVATRCLLGAPA